jgi:hypothetical protein
MWCYFLLDRRVAGVEVLPPGLSDEDAIVRVKGFGRRPVEGRLCGFWGRRSKASQGGNRGEEGRCLVGRDLWRFVGRQQIARVAAQAGDGQSSRRERRHEPVRS